MCINLEIIEYLQFISKHRNIYAIPVVERMTTMLIPTVSEVFTVTAIIQLITGGKWDGFCYFAIFPVMSLG